MVADWWLVLAVPVSVEQTRAIVDGCVSRYLGKVMESPGRYLSNSNPGVSRGYDASNPESDGQARPSIFRPLEEYIISSFKGCDCLNSSFTSAPAGPADASPPPRANLHPAPAPAPLPRAHTEPVFQPDAKTLLLGDLTENSSWWMGDPPQTSGHTRTSSREKPEKSSGASRAVSHRTPRIDWIDLAQWYQSILTAGTAWVDEWSAMRPTAALSEEDAMKTKRFDSIDISMMDREITEARLHLHRTLLKATENLLKRPRRPIKKPEETRFLLILLANPMIYPSSAVSKAQASAASARERRRPSNPHDINRLAAHDVKSPRKEPPKPSGHRSAGPGQHSGIVKRILGIMAHLPDDCHHCLVSWFSRYSVGHFERIVDLFGSFVTYRMTRQHGRKRSESAKNDDGLVPSFSSAAGNTPAELHAALNGRAAGKQAKDKRDRPVVYGDDWQVQAAARVMALLFTANTANIPRKHDRGFGLVKYPSGRRGNMVPISSFYNTLLDYSDLVADFETWESRSSKFSFCQYPFFLSIWAKIHVLEYDARRQMEVKAREAFFNSILNHKAVSQYLVLKVRRDCLVEDSMRGVSEVVGSGQEDIKKGLRIEFTGEEGVDAGGLRKEWFLLLVREVFDPENGKWHFPLVGIS